MRISVVTPSFNQGAFIEDTIRSVVSQREYIHEYFVLDGGSRDNSVDVIKRYSPWIDHWVSKIDEGQADAIKQGFDMATGDVLYWLNSDDVLIPGALKRVHECFTRSPKLDVLSGFAVSIDSHGHIIEMIRRPYDSPRWNRFGYMRVHQPTCFFRRSAYFESGGINPRYHCVLDTELWYRLMAVAPNWGHAGTFLAAYRIHDQMKGQTLTDLYRKERSELKMRFPNAKVNFFTHSAGRIGFYASQLASGRLIWNVRNRSQFAGRSLSSVFGEWEVHDRIATN